MVDPALVPLEYWIFFKICVQIVFSFCHFSYPAQTTTFHHEGIDRPKQALFELVGMTLMQVVGAWGSADVFLGLFLTWRFLLGVGIGGVEVSASH